MAFLASFFATSSIDRHIVAVALPAIGAEFLLNDLQLGILSGIVFSIFFGLGVVPLSLLSVYIDRRHVIALSVFTWSAMTLVSGFAASFVQLMIARIGVGLAEAAGLPASHSVVAEEASEQGRTRAFVVVISGANIGIALSLLAGGLLVQHYGWRMAMIVAGLPGLVLAGLTYLCIDKAPTAAIRQEDSWLAVLRGAFDAVWLIRAKRLAFWGATLISIINFGMVAWLPSFLIRVHELPVQQVGLFVAGVIGLGGVVGNVIVGNLATRMMRRDGAWWMWVPMVALMIGKPFLIAGLLVEDTRLALILLAVPMMVGGAHLATALSLLHAQLSGVNRGSVSSLLMLSVNLTGYTLGPLVVGGMAWILAMQGYGDERLGYALVVLQMLSIPGLIVYYYAGLATRSFYVASPAT